MEEQKKKWGWGKKILAGVCGFFVLLFAIGLFAGDSSKSENTQKASKTSTSSEKKTPVETKKTTYQWNTKELDAMKNGNIPIAIKKMKADGDIKSMAVSVHPSDVAKRPWDYYGKVVLFRGYVQVVQDYPPGNDISKMMGGNGTSEIVMVTDDDTIVDAIIDGSSGSIKKGQPATVFGYPTGVTEVPNAIGGKFSQLIVIGKI